MKFFWVLLFLFLSINAFGQSASSQVNNTSVSILEANEQGAKFLSGFDNTSLRSLSTKEITIQKNQLISDALIAHGIFPEMNASLLVGWLNPELEDINRVTANTRLSIPVVEDNTSSGRKENQWFYLNVSKELGILTSERIDLLGNNFDDLPESSTSSFTSFQNNLATLEQLTLEEYGASATGYYILLDKYLNAFHEESRDLHNIPNSNIDVGSFNKQTEILNAFIKTFNNQKFLRDVKVNVKKGNEKIPECRIHAKIEYFFNDESCNSEPCMISLPGLSSPAEGRLYGAHYLVWGTKAKVGVTDTLKVNVHSLKDDDEIDLTYLGDE
ncbi:MAG: hypothetical protein FH748_06500 [Balneolaceae bacterium]|nr:hypothetical protein [Balneolaceae bacterium]